MFIAIISWILFGLAVGALAKFLTPEADGGTFMMTSLLGVGGAFVGGFIAIVFGFDINNAGGAGFFTSLLMAVIGAIMLLVLYRLGTEWSLDT